MDKRKILIVDDEPDALFILEKELAARGYSVLAARNGNDAMALARSENPDLIILDVAMPDMSGQVVAARLRADIKTKDIPIIFLSCLVQNKAGEEQGRVIAGNVFIAKPYSIKGLSIQIEKLTNRQKGL
jgi:DNA-binding response OmpR family regulator